MDKKREEISENTAFPKHQIWEKKFTLVLEPFCWLKSTIVWTLIKLLKSPDLWFLHGKTITSLHMNKKLEEISKKTSFTKKQIWRKKIQARPGAFVGWNWKFFGHYSRMWNTRIEMPKCPPTSTASQNLDRKFCAWLCLLLDFSSTQ